MSVLSKLLCLDYTLKFNCYELGHSWTSSCTEAGKICVCVLNSAVTNF